MDEDKQQRDQLLPLKSPWVEGAKQFFSTLVTLTGIFIVFDLIRYKAFREKITLVERDLEGHETQRTVLAEAPKAWDIIKQSVVGSALWGGLWGTFNGVSAAHDASRDNNETTLRHENMQLRDKLMETSGVLQQVADRIERSGHGERILAEKAGAAEAAPTIH